MPRSLPVPYYHFINPIKDPIAVGPELFEKHLALLKKRGYAAISLEEALAWLDKTGDLPKKSVLLTFDDGFLDNYTHAFPLLKEHGAKAAIFAVTDRIGDEAPRPTLEDLRQGRIRPEAIPPSLEDKPDELGHEQRYTKFLSWQEAKRMEASGLVSMGAHSASHSLVFTGPDYTHLRMPCPNRRTFSHIDGPQHWGMPLFSPGPALANRAFIPSDRLLTLLETIVPQERAQAHAFFQDQSNEQALRRTIAEVPVERLGRLETDEEHATRVREELGRCKQTLDENMGPGPGRQCLTWPWGTGTQAAYEIARDLGFKYFFTTSKGANRPGNTQRIRRFKAKAKGAAWLGSRLTLYSGSMRARVYSTLGK